MNEIKYGLIDFGLGPENEKCALGLFEYIQKDIADIKTSYIRLGFHLNEFRCLEYFKDLGYSDFYECVEANFGLDKSAVSRCINVWSRFCLDQDGSRKIFIDPKYQDYSYSQLCEMLPMKEKDLVKVTPDMTVREIRDVKKKVATSQPVERSVFLPVEYTNLREEEDRAQYAKNADLQKYVSLKIFDKDGNPVCKEISGRLVELLSDKGNYLVIRV